MEKIMYGICVILLVSTSVKYCLADYSCLCNYAIETPVYRNYVDTGLLGYMYEYDCKEVLPVKTKTDWTIIAFEHKFGYVKKGNTARQICQGDPPLEDILITTPSAVIKTTNTENSTPTYDTSTSSLKQGALLSTEPKPYTNQVVKNSTTVGGNPLYVSSKPSISTHHSVLLQTLTTDFSSRYAMETHSTASDKLSTKYIVTDSSLSHEHQQLSSKGDFPNKRTAQMMSEMFTKYTQPSETSSKGVIVNNMTNHPVTESSNAYTLDQHSRNTDSSRRVSFSTDKLFPELTTQIQTRERNTKDSYLINTLRGNRNNTSGLTTPYGKWNPTTIYANSNTLHFQPSSRETSKLTTNSHTDTITKQVHYFKNVTDENTMMHSEGRTVSATVTLTSNFPKMTMSTNNPTISQASSTMKIMTDQDSSKYTTPLAQVFTSESSSSLKTDGYVSREAKPSTTAILIPNPTNGLITGRPDLCPYHVLAMTNYSKSAGYVYMRQFGQYCYEFRPYLTDWDTARNDCLRRTGDLVVIDNISVHKLLLQMLKDLNFGHDVWLGLHGIGQPGTWRWTNGRTLTTSDYSDWETGNIDGVYGHVQDCAKMNGVSGKWKLAVCKTFLLDVQKHPWICQYKRT